MLAMVSFVLHVLFEEGWVKFGEDVDGGGRVGAATVIGGSVGFFGGEGFWVG